jgi:hypothetical protein
MKEVSFTEVDLKKSLIQEYKPGESSKLSKKKRKDGYYLILTGKFQTWNVHTLKRIFPERIIVPQLVHTSLISVRY